MRSVRVLIADDEAVLRLDLRAMLEDLGHKVVGEADNGEDALIMVRNLKPDVVILDIMMPKMSGLDAAAAISQERIAPVLLLTAYSEASMIDKATNAGVLAYLVKPFRKQELQPAIELAVARYRELVAIESERDGLQEHIETRRIVGKARAVLARRHNLTEREAMRRMQAQSLALNCPLKDVASAILLTEDMDTFRDRESDPS